MRIYDLRTEKGLTLIELLAVVAIVGILASLAVMSYRGYLVRARLQDAKVALETVRAEEEQFRAEFGYFCPPNSLNYFGGVHPLNIGDYSIQFTEPAAIPAQMSSFTVRATPPAGGRQDFASSSKYGGWIEIDEAGSRNSQARANAWP